MWSIFRLSVLHTQAANHEALRLIYRGGTVSEEGTAHREERQVDLTPLNKQQYKVGKHIVFKIFLSKKVFGIGEDNLKYCIPQRHWLIRCAATELSELGCLMTLKMLNY